MVGIGLGAGLRVTILVQVLGLCTLHGQIPNIIDFGKSQHLSQLAYLLNALGTALSTQLGSLLDLFLDFLSINLSYLLLGVHALRYFEYLGVQWWRPISISLLPL